MSAEPDSAAIPPGSRPATQACAPETAPVGRGPGSLLRAAREARQLGIQQVTDLLHIEPRLIAAMEADDFAVFDAPVYARGFLRKYSTFLELPQQEIVAAYEHLHSGPGAPSLIPPATAEERRRDWSSLKLAGAFAGVVVLVAGSYWWWLRAPSAESESAPVVAAAPDAARGPASNAGAVAATAPGVGAATGGTASTGEGASAPVPGAGAADAVATPFETAPAAQRGPHAGSTTAVQTASVPAATTVGAAVSGAAAPPSTVPSGAALEIDFTGECWVEVIGPTGQRLMYDLGKPGESRALPGPGPWRVALGSVDAARLRVSGRPVMVPAANRYGATARLVVGPDGTVQ